MILNHRRFITYALVFKAASTFALDNASTKTKKIIDLNGNGEKLLQRPGRKKSNKPLAVHHIKPKCAKKQIHKHCHHGLGRQDAFKADGAVIENGSVDDAAQNGIEVKPKKKAPVGFTKNFRMSVIPPIRPPTTGPNSRAVISLAMNENPILMKSVNWMENIKPSTTPMAMNRATVTTFFQVLQLIAGIHKLLFQMHHKKYLLCSSPSPRIAGIFISIHVQQRDAGDVPQAFYFSSDWQLPVQPTLNAHRPTLLFVFCDYSTADCKTQSLSFTNPPLLWQCGWRNQCHAR